MPWWTGITPVDGATSIEFYADALEVAKQRAATTAADAAGRLGAINVTAAVAQQHGDVPATILAEADAWGADVVAVGARSLGTVRRWLIGSVSRTILHHAKQSVLIVRPRVAAVPRPEAEAAVTA